PLFPYTTLFRSLLFKIFVDISVRLITGGFFCLLFPCTCKFGAVVTGRPEIADDHNEEDYGYRQKERSREDDGQNAFFLLFALFLIFCRRLPPVAEFRKFCL